LEVSVTEGLLGILLLFAVAGAIAAGMLGLGSVLGPKQRSEVKDTSFECGNEPSGDARGQFGVKFYLIAIMFVLFDVEAAFLFPWAVLYQDLGMIGLTTMGIFAVILGFGLFYVWKRGALEWE
jgi:NADH-quinone oxidoreductase subunit A